MTFSTLLSQSGGTITIEKETTILQPMVRFMDVENGPIELRNFMIDRCLEPNIGIIDKFEVIVENENGNWLWIKNDSACFSGENYEVLEKLEPGSQIEFINIIGLNNQGVKIIFPGMKFVIRKKP
ncbi:MAG: hypothetical protein JKY54_12110 [Flavobacteriales bacterium]|nr:hypothetical protein [Flavobacteriales bacterium]